MKEKVPDFLTKKNSRNEPTGRTTSGLSFMEKTVKSAASVIKTDLAQWESASAKGFMNGLDPRVKLVFLFFFIIIVSLKSNFHCQLAVLCVTLSLGLVSGIRMKALLSRMIFFGFFFGFLVAFPSALNIISDGDIVVPLLTLERSHSWWIYEIPAEIGITREGMRIALLITLRVLNSAGLAFLVMFTTQFSGIVKAMKVLRVPDIFIIIVTLAFKYIFILAGTLEDAYRAMMARSTGSVTPGEARTLAAGRVSFLFRKSMALCDEVYRAMLARGFHGDVKVVNLNRLAARDFAALAIFAAAGTGIMWL